MHSSACAASSRLCKHLDRGRIRHFHFAALARNVAQKLGRAPPVPKDMQMPNDVPTVSQLEWQRPLQLVQYPDPRLRAPNACVAVFGAPLKQLVQEMIPIMYQDDGVGLAAPQVGVNIRLMVFNPEGKAGAGAERVLVNPEVVGVSRAQAEVEEGCLSFPGIQGKVVRPRDVVVRAQDETGAPVTLELGGDSAEGMWLSRIFQHEYDHLNGVLFHDRMAPRVLAGVAPTLVALENVWMRAHPGVAVQRVQRPTAGAGRAVGRKRGF